MMLRIISFALVVALVHSHYAPLYKMPDAVAGHYVVKLTDNANVDLVANTMQDNPFFAMFGGVIGQRFRTVLKGFGAVLPPRALEWVRKVPEVEFIEEESVFKIQSEPEIKSWGLDRIDQADLPLDDIFEPISSMGEGAHIYIIDTGVNPHHDDVKGRCTCDYDATRNTGNLGEGIYCEDCHGHGSHCSGTAAGTTYGIAKKAWIHGVKVLSCIGTGLTTSITGGCEWVATNAIKPAVASMSLGGAASQITDTAVRGIYNSGTTVSVAAGNSDRDACTASPAREPSVITAGASDINDTRAYFSNYGACVDIFAPGVSITSIWQNSTDETYVASGTSMACPHVTGAAALILGDGPHKTPEEVKAAIVNSAVNGKIKDPMGTINKLLQVIKD